LSTIDLASEMAAARQRREEKTARLLRESGGQPSGGVVGLHGTNEPERIPGRPSHGCVRLRNADVAWLATHVTVGTPVIIR